MNNPFKGTGVALVTPFNSDLSIDFEGLRKLVNYQINNGTNFLVVQGTTGESPTLSMAEKMEVLKVVQDENKGRLPIVFGVGGNNTVAVGDLLKNLPEGIDGILSVSPYYNKPIQKGIIEHYKYLAGCTSCPLWRRRTHTFHDFIGCSGGNFSGGKCIPEEIQCDGRCRNEG